MSRNWFTQLSFFLFWKYWLGAAIPSSPDKSGGEGVYPDTGSGESLLSSIPPRRFPHRRRRRRRRHHHHQHHHHHHHHHHLHLHLHLPCRQVKSSQPQSPRASPM